MTLPVRGQAYTIPPLGLVDRANGNEFVSNPTVAVGDFKLSLDGGALANLITPPVVSPPLSKSVTLVLTDAEMNGAKAKIECSDVAGNEWLDVIVTIDIGTASSETIHDLQEGDHVETSTNITINRKNTAEAILQKDIAGSLLPPSVVVRTTET